MKTRWIQAIAVVAALVGCSSSSDTPGDEPGKQPDGTSNMAPTDSVKPPVTGTDTPTPADTTKPPSTDPGTTPPTGTAGSAAPDPGVVPGKDPMVDPMEASNEWPDIRGVGCNPDSGYPGDDACLAPPKEGEGMQIHVGPTDYKNAAEVAKFIFKPNQEASNCWTVKLPNKEDVYYNGAIMSGRAGTHHIINTGHMASAALTEGGFTTVCESGLGGSTTSFGSLPGASKPYMPRRPQAPENKGLGRLIPANAWMTADMHYFNFTDKDILREFWLNIYFIPKDQVTETPQQIRGMGGFNWSFTPIAPGTDKVYQYQAPITADGRIVELLGHYHAHGKRFTAYLKRANGDQLKVFEMYNYLDPLIFDYNSVTKNPPFSDNSGGAFTGPLEVKAGDTLQWECHIVNDSMTGLRYTNMVNTGEMCNMWGASVGPKIDALLSMEVPFEIQAK